MAKFKIENIGRIGEDDNPTWEVFFPEIDPDYPLIAIERSRDEYNLQVEYTVWGGPHLAIATVHSESSYSAARAWIKRTFGTLSPDAAFAKIEELRESARALHKD